MEIQGLEPRMPEASDLQSDAVTCSARSPLVLTHSNSLSFCPIVLCTDERVCVIKQTTHRHTTPFVCSAICFITDSFYTSGLSPQTYHPCLRPHLRHVLHAPQGRVPYNMYYYNKKPQGCQSWGPLEFSVCCFYTLVSSGPRLPSGVRS